jgi:predicted transposase YdaD
MLYNFHYSITIALPTSFINFSKEEPLLSAKYTEVTQKSLLKERRKEGRKEGKKERGRERGSEEEEKEFKFCLANHPAD